MKKYIKALLVVSCLFISSCAEKMYYYAKYSIDLTEIEKPDKTKKSYEVKKSSSIDDNQINEFSFDDDNISIIWIPGAKGFSFKLENKTDSSIKIIWDEALLIDEKNRSLAVIHSGIKFAEREKSQVPSIIVRHSIFEDTIVPSENISYKTPTYYKGMQISGGWQQDEFIPSSFWGYEDESKTWQNEIEGMMLGKKFQVLLPLEIKSKIKEYIFSFKINAIEVKLKKR